MANKTNIRSIRFSDEMAELINQQIGDNFTEKFENLIRQCVWEAPAAERKVKILEAEIRRKQEQFEKLRHQHVDLRNHLVEMELKMEALDKVISKAIAMFDMM